MEGRNERLEEYLVWSQKVRGHLNIILTPLNYFQDEECGEEDPRHPGEDRWKVSGWKVLGSKAAHRNWASSEQKMPPLLFLSLLLLFSVASQLPLGRE